MHPSSRPVVPSIWHGPDTSQTTHFELLYTPGFALDFYVLGLLGLLFNLSSLGLASTHIFLPKRGPNHANLQSQLNKAKTEHNRRNTCLNRKLIQITPKFQAKNHKKYPCIFTLIIHPRQGGVLRLLAVRLFTMVRLGPYESDELHLIWMTIFVIMLKLMTPLLRLNL